MKAFERPIYVTQPFLPPLAQFASGLEEIWQNRWLTNRGPVLKRFEAKLAESLDGANVSVFTNGALALQIAIQGLRLEGEVITTPFTFAATGNALAQNGLTPVFADIEERYWGLDPDRVEALITPRTSAILREIASRSSRSRSYSTTSAPSAAVRSRLGRGASRGMTMTAGMPNSFAAAATPWAWLPEENATTPPPRNAGASAESLL